MNTDFYSRQLEHEYETSTKGETQSFFKLLFVAIVLYLVTFAIVIFTIHALYQKRMQEQIQETTPIKYNTQELQITQLRFNSFFLLNPC